MGQAAWRRRADRGSGAASRARRRRLGDGERREQAAPPGTSGRGCPTRRKVRRSVMSSWPQDDPAAVGAQESADEVEDRGLAGAVVADEADDPTSGIDAERDVVDGPETAEALHQSVDLQHDVLAADGRRRRGIGCSAASGTLAEEHGAQDLRAVEELVGRAAEANLSLLEEHRVLGDLEGDVDRLLDDDDRRARRWISRTLVTSRSTTAGARPRESSSISSSLGLVTMAMASESCCCSPPDRSPACWSRALAAGSGTSRTSSAPPRPRTRRRGSSNRPAAGSRRR